MATEVKSTANNSSSIDDQKVQIKKILVPIDGSDCSLYAAKHAVKLTKDESVQLPYILSLIKQAYEKS